MSVSYKPIFTLNLLTNIVTVTCRMAQCFRSVFCCGFPSEKLAKVLNLLTNINIYLSPRATPPH